MSQYFRPIAVLLCLMTLSVTASGQDHLESTQEQGHTKRIIENLKEIANHGTLDGNRLKMLLPLSSLKRTPGLEQPNSSFYDTVDAVKYIHENSFSQISKDAHEFLLGRHGLIIDDDSRFDLESLKEQLIESRLSLSLDSSGKNTIDVPVQMLIITIKKVKYALITVPINYLMRGLHYTGRALRAGTLFVFAAPAFGTVHVGLLVAFAIKSTYSAASTGLWSLIYLAHEGIYLVTDKVKSKSIHRRNADEIFNDRPSKSSCRSSTGGQG